MSSNKKRFSLGSVLGISLGLASSMGVVNAGEITQVYGTTTPVNVTLMDNIKNAVNDNNTRITNLESGGSGTTCTGNNASDLMVRVGSICVDKYEASLWSDKTSPGTAVTAGSCNVDGSDCTYVAQSRVGVAPTFSVSWLQATQACANAGKRLLTPAEWFMAAVGTVPANCNINGAPGAVANTDANPTCTSRLLVVNMIGNLAEYVDYAQVNAVSGGDGVPRAGYSGGKYDSLSPTLTDRYFANFAVNSAADATVGFRCAR